MSSFYGSPLGMRLIDESRYPDEIKDYLAEERRLLATLAEGAGVVVEVGCMEGRLADWARERGVRYFGLDVEPSFRECWDAREGATFVLGDALDLLGSLREHTAEIPADRSLVVFPFNSMGNVGDAAGVARSLREFGRRFVLLTYETTAAAQSIRHEYYRRCEYEQLHVEESAEGVRFTSSDGLDSVAYHPDYIRSVFARQGIELNSLGFARFGVAWTDLDIRVRKLSSHP